MKSVLIALLILPLWFHVSPVKGGQVSLDAVRHLHFDSDVRIHMVAQGEPGIQILSQPLSQSFLNSGPVALMSQDGEHVYFSNLIGGTLDVAVSNIKLDRIDAGNSALTLLLDNNIKVRLGKLIAANISLDMQEHGRLSVKDIAAETLRLSLHGHGHMSITHMLTDVLDVVMKGHGNIQVAGIARHQKIHLKGHGAYIAEALSSETARVKVRGSATVSLWLTKTPLLTVDVYSRIILKSPPLNPTLFERPLFEQPLVEQLMFSQVNL